MTVSGFDALVESFRGFGMSPEAARFAAIGRNSTEAEARAFWAQPEPAPAAPLAESAGSRLIEPRTPISPEDGATMVAEVARRTLGMGVAEAHQYSVNLMEREIRAGGRDHATRFLGTFARALTPSATR